MEHHPAIDGADEHGLLADGGKIEFVGALGVGLGVGHRLHSALQLDEDDVHAGGDFAVGAVVHHTGDRAGGGEGREGQEQRGARECALHVRKKCCHPEVA